MATLIYAHSGTDAYHDAIATTLKGRKSQPRGIPVCDAGLVVIELETPIKALPVGVGRNLNVRIAALEALQLVAGVAEERAVPWAAKNMKELVLDEHGHQHGNYGRRIGVQARDVVRKLSEDVETRRAVISLWDPFSDNVDGKKDYPCTCTLSFTTRPHAPRLRGDGETRWLDMTVFMRSNDVWLGLPYDLFQFSQLQLSLCRALDLRPGTYSHIANSLHIYERDLAAASRLLLTVKKCEPELPLVPQGIGQLPTEGDGLDPITRWSVIQRRAQLLLRSPIPDDMQLTPGERVYAKIMSSYRTWDPETADATR